MKTGILSGTKRIGINGKTYVYKNNKWYISKEQFPHIIEVYGLFKAHNNAKALQDTRNPKFLKGQLSPEGKIQGARINILPNGKKLDKAFSLFAPHLTFHDESSHDHWDVIYQNPNGKYAYGYTLDKKKEHTARKYHKVKVFTQKYPILKKAVERALTDTEDVYALPMYTLLKTYMRVGSDLYFRKNGHKGLTTLTKKDVAINGNKATFMYIAKDGVPQIISEEFPSSYIQRLKEKLAQAKQTQFIFTNTEGKTLKDTDLMQAFEKYCGERFYPHIVRSFYATKTVEEFLKTHKKTTKQEVQELFTAIAEKLGHKRFSKKDNEWKSSYTVTIHHYIQPELVEKIESMIND